MCTVKLRHKNKPVKCRFVVVPSKSTVLLVYARHRGAGQTENYVCSHRWWTSWQEVRLLDAMAVLNCKTNAAEDHRSDMSAKQSSVNTWDNFKSSTNLEAGIEAGRLITQKIHNGFNYVFTGVRCFKGTFNLRVKQGSHPYQASPRRVAYALWQPSEEELDHLQKQQKTIRGIRLVQVSYWYQRPMAKCDGV